MQAYVSVNIVFNSILVVCFDFFVCLFFAAGQTVTSSSSSTSTPTSSSFSSSSHTSSSSSSFSFSTSGPTPPPATNTTAATPNQNETNNSEPQPQQMPSDLGQLLGSLLGVAGGTGSGAAGNPSITVTTSGVPAFIQGMAEFMQQVSVPVFDKCAHNALHMQITFGFDLHSVVQEMNTKMEGLPC